MTIANKNSPHWRRFLTCATMLLILQYSLFSNLSNDLALVRDQRQWCTPSTFSMRRANKANLFIIFFDKFEILLLLLNPVQN